MNTIVLCFTLKGQPIKQIGDAIIEIYASEKKPILMLSGHMPLWLVKERNFDPYIANVLESLFDQRINFWNHHEGRTLREEMADVAGKLGAKVFVIGDVIDGAAEEAALYQKKNLPIIYKDFHGTF